MAETIAAPASARDERERRKDGDLMLTGKGAYLDDVELPGMMHAAILRSPHAHARIRNVDVARAREAPGVRVVLTGNEALEELGPLPHFFEPSIVGGKTAEFRALAVDKVRYVGDPVATVVADSLANAEAACNLIEVDYEVLPAVVDAEDALASDSPLLFEEWGDNVVFEIPFIEGDAEKALEEAEHVIEDDLSIQRYQTAPMETRGYIGWWDQTGKITLYASTQNPHPLRTNLSTIFGVSEAKIRVVATRMGGGFGHKFNGYAEEPLVCALSKLAGAPVKWIETRAESLLVGAREFEHRFEVGFDSEGRILGMKDRIVGNVGCLATWGGWSMTYPAGMTFPGPYRVKHYHVHSQAVVTNKAPWNGARGYGKESGNLAIERMIDLVAEYLSLDPAEVRQRNFIPPEEFPYWTTAKHLDSGDYAGALEKVLELGEYGRLREEQAKARDEGRLVGVGIGFDLTSEGGDFAGSFVRGFDTSTVRISPSGAITVLTGVTSPGTGNETSIARLVADEFDVPVSQVTVQQGDTDMCPFGFGNFSSRSLTAGGAAAILAARDVKDRLAAAAGVLLEMDPSEITFQNSMIRKRGDGFADAGGGGLSFAHVAEQVYRRAFAIPGLDDPQLESTRTDGPHNFHHIPDEQGRMSAYPSFSYSVHLSLVELDRETGKVNVREYSAVDDCGTVISPTFVAGQLYGAIAMGIGGALYEELPYDEKGQPLAQHFKHYLTPRASDLPSIKLEHQETPSPYTLLGTKGAGETGVGGALSSIANAVNDALRPLGVKIHDMPLSAPKILSEILAGGADDPR